MLSAAVTSPISLVALSKILKYTQVSPQAKINALAVVANELKKSDPYVLNAVNLLVNSRAEVKEVFTEKLYDRIRELEAFPLDSQVSINELSRLEQLSNQLK